MNNKENKVYDIHCPSCGAPAAFDIKKHRYTCSYCGGEVTIGEALEQKKGFRQLQHKKIQDSLKNYQFKHILCDGCGAQLVFEENEALSSCPFCQRALVRGEYVNAENMPELIVPFNITSNEAKDLLKKWCQKNSLKKEGKILSKHIEELKGYYLPYEFLRGPIDCDVRRIDGGRTYSCDGYLDEAFVNSSDQLDNLLLDGMEPYDLNDMQEFDFGYVAGQRVKVDNISADELKNRIIDEVSSAYAPIVAKTMESKAVEVSSDISDLLRMPVLLPVYFLNVEGVQMAINGQTGKVAVRKIKPSYYYFLPWWFKAILATVLFTLIAFAAFTLGGMETFEALYICLILGFFFLIVTLCAYSDTEHTDFAISSGHKIYTSGDRPYRRVNGELVQSTEKIQKNVTPPVFYENLDGKTYDVTLRFSSPVRMLRMILLALFVLFLPVIIALFLTGFDFKKIQLGGSAVWFCIFVPVIPIYLLKFGRIDIYDNPWIYYTDEKGKKRLYRPKKDKYSFKDIFLTILKLLFIPPLCFAVWFAIASFFVIIYLTAGGA